MEKLYLEDCWVLVVAMNAALYNSIHIMECIRTNNMHLSVFRFI